MRKKRVPLANDPIGFDLHLLNMEAYWKYRKLLFKESIRGKLTMSTFVLIMLDWTRIRIMELIL